METPDIVGLIGEFAGIRLRITRRNKLYKRITVIEDGCKLLSWRPLYYVPPAVAQSYRRLLQVYIKTLEFEWWAARTPILNPFTDQLASVVEQMRTMRDQYESSDYLYDWYPVTRKTERGRLAIVPGRGLQEIISFSEPELSCGSCLSAQCMSFYKNIPFS